jgi:uncharacterized protein (TIGR00369 family)
VTDEPPQRVPASSTFTELPLHRHVGVELLDPEHPELGARFTVTSAIEGRSGRLHGGVLSFVLDGVAYLALEPSLAPDEDAVSHDIHISMMRAVRRDQVVELRGRVVKRGRTVCFVDAEATVDGELVATARITKSIVRVP